MSAAPSFVVNGEALHNMDVRRTSVIGRASAPLPHKEEEDRIGRFRLVQAEEWKLFPIQRTILEQCSELADTDPSFFAESLCPILTGVYGVSLRALDWLVTNYSRKTGLVVRGESVHRSYRKKLNTWRRRHFDPFQRCASRTRGKVTFIFDDRTYETTIGQLNFISWAHRTGIVDYIRRHINIIERDMAVCAKERRNRVSSGATRTTVQEENIPACIISRGNFTLR